MAAARNRLWAMEAMGVVGLVAELAVATEGYRVAVAWAGAIQAAVEEVVPKEVEVGSLPPALVEQAAVGLMAETLEEPAEEEAPAAVARIVPSA